VNYPSRYREFDGIWPHPPRIYVRGRRHPVPDRLIAIDITNVAFS